MDDGGGGLFGMIILLIQLGIFVAIIASFWIIFTKAGEPGFMAIIPLVNFIAAILVTVALAEKFGKGIGFAIGMLFLPFIFYPILAFGDAQYQG